MEPADLGDAITSAHDEASVADTGTCVHRTGRSCTLCGATSTPQWREGPMGPKTLCNACGVKQMRQAKKRGDLAGRNGKRATASKAKQTDTSTRLAADSSRAVKGSHLSNSSAIVPAAFPTITAGNDQYHLPHHDYNDSLPSAPVGSRPAHIEQETEGTETMGAQGDLPEEDEAAAQELLEFASLAAGSSASEDNGDADTWQLGHDAQVEQEQEDGEWLHGGGVRRGKRRREPSSRARALTELLDADLIAGRGRVGSSPAGRKRRIDPLVLLESYSAWQVSFDAVPHHTQPQRSPMKWFGMPAGNSETASGQGGLLQRASPSLQSAMGMAGAAIRYSTSTLSDDSAGIGMPHSLLGITPLSTGGLGPGGQGLGMGRGLGLARLSVETLTALDNLLSMAGNPRGPPPISDMPAMLQPVAAPLTAPLMPGRLEGGADDMDSECDDTTAAPAALLSRLPLAQLSAGERAQLLAMQEAMKTACARLALAELEKRATQQMLAESEEVARQAHARLQKHLQHLQHELQEALGALGKLARPVVATSVATIPLGPGGLRWPAVDPFSSLATPSPASCFPPC